MTIEQVSSDENGLYSKSYNILRTYATMTLNIGYIGDNEFSTYQLVHEDFCIKCTKYQSINCKLDLYKFKNNRFKCLNFNGE